MRPDPIWNKGTPMPRDYTCHCGLAVHPQVRDRFAIHIPDCPYAPQPMTQFERIEWVPGRWWLVEVTGSDGSYTPHRQLSGP